MPEQPLVDDPSILDEDDLWRRVPPYQIIRDSKTGELRASSAAFDDDELSVDVAKDSTVEKTLAGHDGFSLVGFPARLPRENGQIVVRKPLESNPAHAEVLGRKSGAVKKALYRGSTWVHREGPNPEK